MISKILQGYTWYSTIHFSFVKFSCCFTSFHCNSYINHNNSKRNLLYLTFPDTPNQHQTIKGDNVNNMPQQPYCQPRDYQSAPPAPPSSSMYPGPTPSWDAPYEPAGDVSCLWVLPHLGFRSWVPPDSCYFCFHICFLLYCFS